jgi:hypothetical protein
VRPLFSRQTSVKLSFRIARGRLKSLYRPWQSLVLRNLPAGGVEARITLPFRIEAERILVRRGDYVELQSINR